MKGKEEKVREGIIEWKNGTGKWIERNRREGKEHNGRMGQGKGREGMEKGLKGRVIVS